MDKCMEERNRFYVLRWDFNNDQPIYYDVLPYLRTNVGQLPSSIDKLKASIQEASLYKFHGQCEYETIIHCWPKRMKDYKISVHDQVMMNIDVIASILWDELSREEKDTADGGTIGEGILDPEKYVRRNYDVDWATFPWCYSIKIGGLSYYGIEKSKDIAIGKVRDIIANKEEEEK